MCTRPARGGATRLARARRQEQKRPSRRLLPRRGRGSAILPRRRSVTLPTLAVGRTMSHWGFILLDSSHFRAQYGRPLRFLRGRSVRAAESIPEFSFGPSCVHGGRATARSFFEGGRHVRGHFGDETRGDLPRAARLGRG